MRGNLFTLSVSARAGCRVLEGGCSGVNSRGGMVFF